MSRSFQEAQRRKVRKAARDRVEAKGPFTALPADRDPPGKERSGLLPHWSPYVVQVQIYKVRRDVAFVLRDRAWVLRGVYSNGGTVEPIASP